MSEIRFIDIFGLLKVILNFLNFLSKGTVEYKFKFEIVEDKYVLNITSNLWDKISDINNSLYYIKQQIKSHHKLSLVSFDDVYSYYQGYCTSNSIKFVVSKRYFEKYLYYKFVDYIVYEKFIKVEWINT